MKAWWRRLVCDHDYKEVERYGVFNRTLVKDDDGPTALLYIFACSKCGQITTRRVS